VFFVEEGALRLRCPDAVMNASAQGQHDHEASEPLQVSVLYDIFLSHLSFFRLAKVRRKAETAKLNKKKSANKFCFAPDFP